MRADQQDGRAHWESVEWYVAYIYSWIKVLDCQLMFPRRRRCRATGQTVVEDLVVGANAFIDGRIPRKGCYTFHSTSMERRYVGLERCIISKFLYHNPMGAGYLSYAMEQAIQNAFYNATNGRYGRRTPIISSQMQIVHESLIARHFRMLRTRNKVSSEMFD